MSPALIGLLAIFGCSDPSAPRVSVDEVPCDLEVEVSTEIATTAEASFPPPDAASEAWVEFGLDGAFDLAAPAVLEDGVYTAQLVGMKPERRYDVRAVAVVDGAAQVVGESVVETGAAPGGLSRIDVADFGTGANPGAYMFTSLQSAPSYAVILDQDGDYVWWHQSPVDGGIVMRTLPLRDGSGVIYLVQVEGEDTGEDSLAVRVSWDGQVVNEEVLPLAHHDLVETGSGELLYLAFSSREIDGINYRADRLMQRAADGHDREVWSIWDDFLPEPGEDPAAGMGWSHSNSLDLDEASNHMLLGIRRFSAIVNIDVDQGRMLWQLGGDDSDFSFDDEEARFTDQHQFELLPDDHILIFDNGSSERLDSRAVEYALDFETHHASLVWEYSADPPLYTYGPGDVHRLDDGNTMVVFGSSGRVDLVDPSGRLVWMMLGSVGAGFGYVHLADELRPEG